MTTSVVPVTEGAALRGRVVEQPPLPIQEGVMQARERARPHDRWGSRHRQPAGEAANQGSDLSRNALGRVEVVSLYGVDRGLEVAHLGARALTRAPPRPTECPSPLELGRGCLNAHRLSPSVGTARP